MRHRSNCLALAGLSLLATSIANAHHAGVAYDHANQVTVAGTVKEFQWTNPHTWIIVMVPDGNGGEEQWPLEGTSINTLVRAGWTVKTLQPGMKVKILVSPRKDSTPGGEWNKVISINDVPFTPPVAQP
jgi:hypothetical protein